MKNKFLQHKKDAIGNIILTAVLLIVILLPWIFRVNSIISIGTVIVLGPILILGFIQGLRNQEFDVITFTKEGVTTQRIFRKASLSWDDVSSVKYGNMLQPAAVRGEKKIKKLIIHATDPDDGSAIKLYMDDREEILESIKYYKGLSKG